MIRRVLSTGAFVLIPTLASGSPEFQEYAIPTYHAGMNDFVLADVDADGDLDIAYAPSRSQFEVRWLENRGGSPLAFVDHLVGEVYDPVYLHAADLNNDGLTDIAVGAHEEAVWFENTGAGFIEHRLGDHTLIFGAGGADFDGDGWQDLTFAAFYDNEAVVYTNGGEPGFAFTQHPMPAACYRPVGLAVGDLEGDGDPDIVVSSLDDQTIHWYRNDGGTPGAWSHRVISSSYADPAYVDLADLDGDGDLDVMGTAQPHPEYLHWFENLGNEQFTHHGIPMDATNYTRAEPGDLDGDGDTDIAYADWIVNHSEGTVDWLENIGGQPPEFVKRSIPTTSRAFVTVRIGDLDGDGDADIVSASNQEQTPSLFLFENLSDPAGCNPADLAEPWGQLDLADIGAFLGVFADHQPDADLAEPFGVWDLADVVAFVEAFLAGCA
jgi:hypothetical protein